MVKGRNNPPCLECNQNGRKGVEYNLTLSLPDLKLIDIRHMRRELAELVPPGSQCLSKPGTNCSAEVINHDNTNNNSSYRYSSLVLMMNVLYLYSCRSIAWVWRDILCVLNEHPLRGRSRGSIGMHSLRRYGY